MCLITKNFKHFYFIICFMCLRLSDGSGEHGNIIDSGTLEAYPDSEHMDSYQEPIPEIEPSDIAHQNDYQDSYAEPAIEKDYGIGEQNNYHNVVENKPGVIVNNDYNHKGSIIINAERTKSSQPIIINHGAHHKHISDIIIHDNKCGSPTRIKETKHGLFGLFHKSHIIIIGKDCNEKPAQLVPVYAPAHYAPVADLHHSHSRPIAYHSGEEWRQRSRLTHWPESGGQRHTVSGGSAVAMPMRHRSVQRPVHRQSQLANHYVREQELVLNRAKHKDIDWE